MDRKNIPTKSNDENVRNDKKGIIEVDRVEKFKSSEGIREVWSEIQEVLMAKYPVLHPTDFEFSGSNRAAMLQQIGKKIGLDANQMKSLLRIL